MLTIQIPGRSTLDGVMRQVTERVIHPVGRLVARLLPGGTTPPDAAAPAAPAAPTAPTAPTAPAAPTAPTAPAKRRTPAQRGAAARATKPDLRRGDPRVHDLVAELDEAIDAGNGPAIEDVGQRLHALDHNAGAGGDT